MRDDLVSRCFEDMREDRLLDSRNGGLRGPVDSGGHDETQQCSECRLAMPAIDIIPANARSDLGFLRPGAKR